MNYIANIVVSKNSTSSGGGKERNRSAEREWTELNWTELNWTQLNWKTKQIQTPGDRGQKDVEIEGKNLWR
jgi:hypothetical protein